MTSAVLCKSTLHFSIAHADVGRTQVAAASLIAFRVCVHGDGAIVFDRAAFTQSQPARRGIKLTPLEHAERAR